MIKGFGGLKDFFKTKNDIVINGPVFKFHCQFTAVILIAFSTVLTMKQFIGDPIQCIVDGGLPAKPITTFCWIMSTYTLPTYGKQIGVEAAHPGVLPDNDHSVKKYHSYYQWVCFVLFLQGIACYIPKWLWDHCEGDLMHTLVSGLNHYIFTEKEKNLKKDIIVNYVLSHTKMHRMYAIRYWFCESLCFINILAQLYLMDKFFDGQFMQYGLQVLELADYGQESRDDPMIFVFPRVTKCSFHKYGPSGSIQPIDALCVLPQNVVNEKTYIFIWFWFIFLTCMLTLLMLYRICLIVFPPMRPRLLKVTRKVVSRRDARIVTSTLNVTDWWVLYMIGKNMDQIVYNQIVEDLARRMQESDVDSKR